MSWLYTSKDIVYCILEGRVVVKKVLCIFLRNSLCSLPVSLLCLLGHKIFTQPGAYCCTDYCSNTRVDYHFTEKIPTLSSLL